MNKFNLDPDITFKVVLDNLGIKYPENRIEVLISSPLREDKNPSFSINLDKGVFKDHSTGDKGDLITFWGLYRGLNTSGKDFIQIIKELNQITGYLENENITGEGDKIKNIKQINYPNYEQNINKCQVKFDVIDVSIHTPIYKEFVNYLSFTNGGDVRKDTTNNKKTGHLVRAYKFLNNRNLDSGQYYDNMLGSTFNICEYSLKNHMLKTFTIQEIFESGLFNIYGYLLPRYTERLIIPYIENGKIGNIQFRNLRTDIEIEELKIKIENKELKDFGLLYDRKYVNLSLPKKDNTQYKYYKVWGLSEAIYACNDDSKVFITESVLDAISAIELGHLGIAIGSVANVTDDVINQMSNLLAFKPTLVIALDNDSAGQVANTKMISMLIDLGYPKDKIESLQLLDGIKDINQFLIRLSHVKR